MEKAGSNDLLVMSEQELADLTSKVKVALLGAGYVENPSVVIDGRTYFCRENEVGPGDVISVDMGGGDDFLDREGVGKELGRVMRAAGVDWAAVFTAYDFAPKGGEELSAVLRGNVDEGAPIRGQKDLMQDDSTSYSFAARWKQ